MNTWSRCLSRGQRKQRRWQHASSALAGLLLGVPVALAEVGPGHPVEAGVPASLREGGTRPVVGETGSPTPAWVRAYSQGQWSIAADLIETIPEVSRTPWHWLHLARAREKRGQLVEAFAAYERLRENVPSERAVAGRQKWQRQAEAEAEALAGRIPWAQIALAADVPAGAYLFVDQQWLAPGRVRSPYPVNPGWHTFLLEVQGEIKAARRVHFEEGQNRSVVLSSLEREDVASPASEGSGGSRLELGWSPAADARSVADTRRARLRTISYVSLGIGGLGVIVGTGFAIVSLDKRDELIELERSCAGANCLSPAHSNRLIGDIRRASAAANGGFVVGGIGLVTGAVLLLLQRKNEPQPAARIAGVELDPLIGVDALGVSGRF
jgi:hypothetical protein